MVVFESRNQSCVNVYVCMYICCNLTMQICLYSSSHLFRKFTDVYNKLVHYKLILIDRRWYRIKSISLNGYCNKYDVSRLTWKGDGSEVGFSVGGVMQRANATGEAIGRQAHVAVAVAESRSNVPGKPRGLHVHDRIALVHVRRDHDGGLVTGQR